jgi:hypothetical protein
MTPTTEEIERHTRLAHRLDSDINERRFWISLTLHGDGDGREDEAIDVLTTNVDKWLSSLSTDEAWSEETFNLAGWHLTVRAYPRGRAAFTRGGVIVANPFPSYAFWANG